MKKAVVSLGPRSYDVVVGAGLMHSVLEHLVFIEGFEKVALVSDTNVDPLYGDRLSKQFQAVAKVERLVVDAGEAAKSWTLAGELLEELAARQMRRHDVIVTLGGGVVSDLGGFVASCYLRGVRVVHFPTTLLGQVDAAIGGKTGVNLTRGKNLAGSFYQPSAVLCDVETLLTLPPGEFRSGLAEVIKYGLCFDPNLLNFFHPVLRDDDSAQGADLADPHLLEQLVFRCAEIKAGVVSEDETDKAGRLILNYGHTFGHALEAAGGFRRWSHGEAISVGMVFAAHLARRSGLLGDADVELHRRLFQTVGLPPAASFDPAEVSGLWAMDKKRQKDQRWVLLEAIGKPVIRLDVAPADIEAAIEAVRL